MERQKNEPPPKGYKFQKVLKTPKNELDVR
jgi:hypothetical protein